RIKDLVSHLCKQGHFSDSWQYEIAALMSQIGCITLPADILHKLYAGVELTLEERRMYEHHPEVGRRLFANIPRMEQVASMVGMQLSPFSAFEEEAISLEDANICRGAQMLRVAIDYDLLRYQGLTHKEILKKMRKMRGVYNPEMLNALEGLRLRSEQGKVVNLRVKDIQTGMVAEEDVFANNGVLVIPRGQVVTWPILQGLDNFSKQVGIQEPICMRMPSSEEDPSPEQ
ncbi:MAG: two-component system response regulator, partial [Proteobacteria bacterium]|nr:two-component system response regulator [Pseudomonadota bacterium]